MITFQPNMRRSLCQTLGTFVKSLIEILFFIAYFTFPYNTSFWIHEFPQFLTCQLYTVGKGVLFAPKPVTDISSQVVARPLGETGFLLCAVGRSEQHKQEPL